MNKNPKTLIISLIAAGLMSSSGADAFSMNLNFLKKKDSQAVEKQENAKKSEKNKKTEKTQKAAQPEKLQKTEKPKKAKKIKKAKKEKYDDTVVTAKTDKNKPSVKIIVKGKKADKETKPEKKAKLKKDKKEKNAKTNALEEKEIKLQQQAGDTKVETDDVFAPSKAVEGSVSAMHIISVDDCVKIALENNPTILSQLISKDIYKNQIAQAWSNYFPTLNAQISYSRNDMMVTNFKFPMQKYNLWNMPNVGFNQLLYDFGKTGAQAGVAKKTYEASRETLQAGINDVVYQVKNAYYNQLFLQQQVEVYEDSVLQYQIHLEQAKAYYAIGGKAKIDVSTAQYNLDNTKLTLVQAKNAVESGFAQLTNAMGVPEFAKFDIQDRLDKRRYDITFDDSLKIACEQNPTLLAAKKKMEGSKLLVKSSKVAFLPNLTGFGSYSKGGGTPSKDYGYQLGAQLSYSNLNLLLLKQQVDEATLTYKKDQADYETQRQKVYLDVKQAYIQLKNAQESIPVARSSMDVAKERYELAAGRYKAGLGDAIELKDAQNEYMNAKLQYYNTLMQYHISAANLERVIGAPLTASEVSL
ncbi:MAG: TolC family protein [Clostridium sp.]|nr:TolC family protein [Clostridium sp.]